MGKAARLIAKGLKQAKSIAPELYLPATLIKVSPGTRGASVSAGTHPTEASFPARGFIPKRTYQFINGTSVSSDARVFGLLGATIAGGQRPVANDKLTIDGETFRLEAVDTDPFRAVYLCLARR